MAIQFLTQPISTIYSLSRSNEMQDEIIQANISLISRSRFLGNPVPSEIEIKIKDFLTSELKVREPEKFILRVIPGEGYSISTIGCTHCAKWIICFSPKSIEDLETDFNVSHKFAIAHEIGHLEHDDCCEGKLERQKASQMASLIGYFAIVVAYPLFPAAGFLGTHLLGCTLAKCAELYTRNRMQKQAELRADLYAAKQSSEIASGGVIFIKRCQQENLHGKQKWLSELSGNTRILTKMFLDILVTPNGDITPLISDHPLGQTRIDQIATYLSNSTPKTQVNNVSA